MEKSNVRVPTLEVWLGAAWWLMGATAFEDGIATALLAVGLVAAGWLLITIRRVVGPGAELPPGGRAQLLSTIFITGMLTAGLAMGLRALPDPYNYGELAAPAGTILIGIALVKLAPLLNTRLLTVVGISMVVLGVAWAALALGTANDFYGHGIVGLGVGALLWLVGAARTGCVAPWPRSHVQGQ